MKWIVNNPDGYATNLREFADKNLTLTNSSAVDVYYEVAAQGGGINAALAGAVPSGTKIAANGGTIQWQNAPDNIWVRAASQTVLDVQSDAGDTRYQHEKNKDSKFGASAPFTIPQSQTDRNKRLHR
jgi:hypothetical protein